MYNGNKYGWRLGIVQNIVANIVDLSCVLPLGVSCASYPNSHTTTVTRTFTNCLNIYLHTFALFFGNEEMEKIIIKPNREEGK